MRDFKNMKRQRSRNRGGGNGGGKPQQNANRAFESNGPDGVKIRGAAQHVFEKYQQLARDALTAGDRVLGESYQQHAEHYFRVLRAVQPGRPASDIIGRDAFASGFDIDFEDESGGNADTETQPETNEADNGGGENREWRQEGRQRDDRQQQNDRPRDDRPREDRNNQQRDRNYNRDDRPRDNGQRDNGNFNRDDRPREDRNYNRDDRPRDGNGQRDRNVNRDDRQQQSDRPREDRGSREDRPQREDQPRDERPREDRPPRENRPRYDRNNDRGERAERVDPLAVVEPRATPLTAEAEPKSSPVLRSHDGDVSHTPAFLQAPPRAEPVADAGEAAPKPKRPRKPRASAATASDIVSSEDA
jgi:hypothetical protein